MRVTWVIRKMKESIYEINKKKDNSMNDKHIHDKIKYYGDNDVKYQSSNENNTNNEIRNEIERVRNQQRQTKTTEKQKNKNQQRQTKKNNKKDQTLEGSLAVTKCNTQWYT